MLRHATTPLDDRISNLARPLIDLLPVPKIAKLAAEDTPPKVELGCRVGLQEPAIEQHMPFKLNMLRYSSSQFLLFVFRLHHALSDLAHREWCSDAECPDRAVG